MSNFNNYLNTKREKIANEIVSQAFEKSAGIMNSTIRKAQAPKMAQRIKGKIDPARKALQHAIEYDEQLAAKKAAEEASKNLKKAKKAAAKAIIATGAGAAGTGAAGAGAYALSKREKTASEIVEDRFSEIYQY